MAKNTKMKNFLGVAKSQNMNDLLNKAKQYASVNRPILIRGERGTGKELLAKFIHENSKRELNPFISINCAAITEQLLTSELYGHEKGAFTGANQSRIGKLEQADTGTLFMDEIGNMSISFQKLILRVIEYQEFEKVRGTEKIKVDVRIIVATNADLEEMIKENLFLPDLFDRLTFVELTLPPLRQRKDEIPHLIVHFVQMLHEEIPNLEQKQFSKESVLQLMQYHWPGNIRELKNVIERLYLGPTDHHIRPQDLPHEISGLSNSPNQDHNHDYEGTFHEKVESFQKDLIQKALNENKQSQKKAALQLGMSYDQLRHYYKKFNLKVQL